MDSLVRVTPEQPSWACPPTSAQHMGGDVGADLGTAAGAGVGNSEFGPCLSCEGLGTRSGGDSGVPESSGPAPEPAVRTRGGWPGESLPSGRPCFAGSFIAFLVVFSPGVESAQVAAGLQPWAGSEQGLGS